MKTFFRLALALVLSLGISSRVPALPEPLAAAGRKLMVGISPSIVSVEIVATVKIAIGGRTLPPREQRMEANGTVLSSSGLTVTSLTEIDPRGEVEAILRNRPFPGGQRPEIGATDYKDAKLRLADGSEVPAWVVLKDPDLDLIFLAPAADPSVPKRTFAFMRLDQPAEPAVLGDYFVVSRAGNPLQRIPQVYSTTISAIAEKPKRLFLPTFAVPGCPVLDADGRVVGLGLVLIADGRPVLATRVVLPTAALADELKQAETAAAKPPPAPLPAEDDETPAPPQPPAAHSTSP